MCIRDRDEAIALSPDDYTAYLERGFYSYVSGTLEIAFIDLTKALELDLEPDGRDYISLWLWMTLTQMGESSKADGILSEHVKARNSENGEEWYLYLAAFLLDSIDETRLLDLARSSQPEKQAEYLCEAYFYTGNKRLLNGDIGGALKMLELCLETRVNQFYEYSGAKVQLARFSQQLSTPPVQGNSIDHGEASFPP